MRKYFIHFILLLILVLSTNGCTANKNKNTNQSADSDKVKISPELKQAIGNIDNLDSNKMKNIPVEELNISY